MAWTEAHYAGRLVAGFEAVVAEVGVQAAAWALADGTGCAEVLLLQEGAVEAVLLDAVAGEVRQPDGVADELQVLVPGAVWNVVTVGGAQRIGFPPARPLSAPMGDVK